VLIYRRSRRRQGSDRQENAAHPVGKGSSFCCAHRPVGDQTPTGRRVSSEAIHSCWKLIRRGGFKRGDDNPLDCDLLVVDEIWSCSPDAGASQGGPAKAAV
jgi:hypothetical protein